ncbi:MAG: phosphomannomutase/phosphoglucomutase [Candidatus Aenigmatarchaeota archaeon]
MTIFRFYDVRGRYPEELGEKTAFKIGSAFANFLNGDKVVVGRDARKSSDKIKNSLISGLYSGDKEVLDMGLSTTPMFYFAANSLDVDGGVMITASHLVGSYNGFKFVGEDGFPISSDSGLNDIEEMSRKEKYEFVRPNYSKIDVQEDYLDFFSDIEIDLDGKIVVDTSNGMAGLTYGKLLQKIGMKYVPINFKVDCRFPNHKADPLVESNLSQLKKRTEAESHLWDNILFGVMLDGDGDRIGFVDEKGESIQGDIITALIAKKKLQEGKEKVLYDARSSKIIPEVVEENGGEAIETRVGHSFIKDKMREVDAGFAGEVSGHYYFRDFFYSESPILTVVSVLKMISSTGKKLSELVKPLQKYAKTEELNYRVKDKKSKMEEIEDKYSSAAEIYKLDGLTVKFDDWWFNLRPSRTEDFLRLNLEANNEELMESKTDEIEKIIKN